MEFYAMQITNMENFRKDKRNGFQIQQSNINGC